MANIECECGTLFEIASTAMRVVCPGCKRRFTVPETTEPLALHSQFSSTMLHDLPVVTNIEQHYAQSILAVGMSIPAGAYAAAGAAVVASGSYASQVASSRSPSSAGRSTRATGSSVAEVRTKDAVNASGLAIGDGLLGRYEILGKIGQGGMSSVYEAHDHVRDESVALKVLLPHLISQPRMQERFLQEGRISSNFSHPNIARVYDLHQTESQMVLSMELLHGTTLRYDMHRRKQQGQNYRASEVASILSQICDALAIVHAAGVVHRDLKPENLWLGLDGTVKVMDFGIAREAARGAHTTGPRGSGTPYYIAPEQLTASRILDHRADQYSLAVIAYELLTGDIPQGAVEPPHVKNPQIPKRLSQAIFRGLDADPSQRFPSINAFRLALHYDRKLPLLARAAITSLLLAGLGSGGYAFARWGMPMLEPKVVPIWSQIQSVNAKEREAIELPVKDPQSTLAAPALEFQLLNDAPVGATIDKDGVIHWTPAENQAPKKHTFKVQALVSDNGQIRKEEQTIEINVGELFDSPVFETPTPVKAVEHQELVVDLSASDPNQPQIGLRYELENPSPGMTIDAHTGRLRWTPDENAGGIHLDVAIRVSLDRDDQTPVATTRRLSIDVEESIDALIFTSSERLSAEVGKAVSFRALAHDPNLPTLNTFYRLQGGERLGMTIDPKSGEIAWTPKEDASGKSFDVTVEACRDDGGKIQSVGRQALKINVAETKPEPPPEPEAEAPSPSDTASRGPAVQHLPETKIDTPPTSSLPTGQSGSCPATTKGGNTSQGQPPQGQPPQRSGNSGTCPPKGSGSGQNKASTAPTGGSQLGNVILDVVDKAVKVHQQREQTKQSPNNKPPVKSPPFPQLPANPLPGQIFVPPNGNTGFAGGIHSNSTHTTNNHSRPTPANHAPMNQAPSLQSILKQKIEHDVRSRAGRR